MGIKKSAPLHTAILKGIGAYRAGLTQQIQNHLDVPDEVRGRDKERMRLVYQMAYTGHVLGMGRGSELANSGPDDRAGLVEDVPEAIKICSTTTFLMSDVAEADEAAAKLAEAIESLIWTMISEGQAGTEAAAAVVHALDLLRDECFDNAVEMRADITAGAMPTSQAEAIAWIEGMGDRPLDGYRHASTGELAKDTFVSRRFALDAADNALDGDIGQQLANDLGLGRETFAQRAQMRNAFGLRLIAQALPIIDAYLSGQRGDEPWIYTRPEPCPTP